MYNGILPHSVYLMAQIFIGQLDFYLHRKPIFEYWTGACHSLQGGPNFSTYERR